MKQRLAYLVAFALAALPVAAQAQAVDLVNDDGAFEASTPITLPAVPPPSDPPAPLAPAVQFDVPGTGVYALDSVSFYLLKGPEAVPVTDGFPVLAPPPIETYPVTVQVWNEVPAESDNWVPGATINTEVSVGAEGWYDLPLTEDPAAEKVVFTGSVRIGIFLQPGYLPPASPLNLGVDTDGTDLTPPMPMPMPFQYSYGYDSTVAPPVWIPADGSLTLGAGNYGIRATVLVPALTCQGFLPPFNRLITMKKGGRTLPLKAKLFDDMGYPVTRRDLNSPPLVQILYTPFLGETADVTDKVPPAGRSNKGQAFRNAGKGTWIYNLKTKKDLPPGTYTILMDTGDEAEYWIDTTCEGTFVIEAPMVKKPKPGKGPK